MLQDEIGSIMRFCYDKNPVKTYSERIPQDMIIPCMYFPEPIIVSSSDTIYAYVNVYQIFIKIFAQKTQAASRMAHDIAEEFRKRRGIISLVNHDGSLTGQYMQINLDIQTKPLDEGVAQLSLKWKSRYLYQRRDPELLMGSLKITGRLKE